MPDVRLPGCTARPLGAYLKALGVVRLVATQVDRDTRARWAGGALELRSALDLDGLRQYLLQQYAPSAILSPWNGGSGFFPGDKTAGAALRALEASSHDRFRTLRAAIGTARAVLDRLGLDDKPQQDELRDVLRRDLRAALPDDALDWLDAAVILHSKGRWFPPLLGSGGNDSRFEFSGNFLIALTHLFDSDGGALAASSEQLDGALLRTAAALPKATGGSHLLRDSSPRSPGDNLGNPWDFVLAIEGATVLSAGAARRHAAQAGSELSAPFTTAASAAGYGSAAAGEKGRGELWLPVWSGWTSFPELRNLAREARITVGRRAAATGIDVARAARTLGVARGIDAFERVALLERAGQSGLAVSAGRIEVREEPAARLLDRIDPWLRRVLRLRSAGTATQRLAVAQLERAAYAFAAEPAARSTQELLVALARMERAVAIAGARAPAGLRPVSLGPGRDWVAAAADGSAELAFAAGVAALQPAGGRAVRDHLIGTGVDDRGRRSYAVSTREVPARAGAIERLARLHVWRVLRASNADEALVGRGRVAVGLAALRAVVAAEFDSEHSLALAEGLALAEWRDGVRLEAEDPGPWPALDLLVFTWHGAPLVREQLAPLLGPRPEWPTLLRSDRVATVIAGAHLRLRRAGLVPLVAPDDLLPAAPDGPALLAALLVPPRLADLHGIARRLIVRPELDPQELTE